MMNSNSQSPPGQARDTLAAPSAPNGPPSGTPSALEPIAPALHTGPSLGAETPPSSYESCARRDTSRRANCQPLPCDTENREFIGGLKGGQQLDQETVLAICEKVLARVCEAVALILDTAERHAVAGTGAAA